MSSTASHSAKHLLNVRHRHRRLRKKLQKKGTKSAKRLLKYLSGKECRFSRDVNHCISKQLVSIAKGTQRGIALEELRGIRDRVNVPRKRRNELHSRSFHQLRSFVEYKAERCGVPVVYVDPRNTSRTCTQCGGVDKRNRKTQSQFLCTRCGFVSHADVNAAVNISRWAAVNPPHATSVLGVNPALVASPRFSYGVVDKSQDSQHKKIRYDARYSATSTGEEAMTSYKLCWYVQGRVLFVRLSGALDDAAVVSLNEALWEALDQGTPLVHIIMDGTHLTSVPLNVGKLRQASKVLDHPHLGWVLTVGTNRILNFIASMVTQMITKTRYRPLPSVEETVTFLQERDLTINWEHLDEKALR